MKLVGDIYMFLSYEKRDRETVVHIYRNGYEVKYNRPETVVSRAIIKFPYEKRHSCYNSEKKVEGE